MVLSKNYSFYGRERLGNCHLRQFGLLVSIIKQALCNVIKVRDTRTMVANTLVQKPALTVWVNGKRIVEKNPNPTESLIAFVRRHGYTGTKLGCAEGGCGSCTVVVSSFDYQTRQIVHNAVNACLAPICSVDHKHVVTIEGIGSVDKLHPVQEHIAKSIAMSLYASLRNNKEMTEHDIEHSFDGNLCRCTGYRSILDGAKKKCKESCATNGECHSVDPCDKGTAVDIEDFIKVKNKEACFSSTFFLHFFRSLRPPTNPAPSAYFFESNDYKWYHPSTVEELLTIMDEYPQARIINGNTEVGIETRFKNQKYTVLISPVDIESLKKVEVLDNGIRIGASTTISTIQKELKSFCKTMPAYKTRGFEAILENCQWFAGTQVRNVAAIAGNIVTASPISDLNPVFVALGAILTVRSSSGSRTIPMEDFFLGYRKTDLSLRRLWIVPYCREFEYVKAYKQAKRKDDDIAIVNGGIRVLTEKQADGSWIAKEASLSYGGMAKESSKFLVGKKWEPSLVDEIAPLILKDLPLTATAPGGQIEFRKLLAVSFFLKFHLFVTSELSALSPDYSVASTEISVLKDIQRPLSSGQQAFTETPEGNVVGRSYMHASALKQITGSAIYIDDIPVHQMNALIYEELFATEEVFFVGQPIGLIVADTLDIAVMAAKLKSFFDIERKITTGAFWKALKKLQRCKRILHFVEGTARMSGQEHFYLETQASLVVPKKEDNEIEHPTETQHMVSHVLGIPANRVVVRVKRMGGGFGGKETRSVFVTCLLAVAAKKYSRPMRLMLSREEDMAISGTRHPFLGKYRVGYKPDGKLVSLELELFSNGGYSLDLSVPVLERAITHSDNSYKIPNVQIVGKVCKTNLPTNTAFRGFGGPQGMMIAEQWMTHVVDTLQKPGDEIRALNFYKDGDITHFSCPLEDFHMDRVWSELLETSEYKRRLADVETFNAKNRYRKRGIIVMPTKFGLAFTARFYNQAGALVHVYTDGSVLIAHGGTEMGQGLHTKMIQIAAQAFGNHTNTVANTSATAASVLREANPGAPWEDVVKKAYFERINLSANGTPDLTYDWASNTGRMFSYFTYGGACTEVEIDTLTGDHVVLRSDVVMDIGTPINPAIDIGQIEGAFAQGQGWCTIEEPLISPTSGFLFTRGPGGYKIPGFRDIPVDFRVRIVQGSRNARAVHSSKAVGEPPLFMGASVFYAVKEAIKAARENGLTGFFRLDSPATSERIRTSCIT
ncbi:molybdopterin binding aldehyde oxidase/xanthine dehydrogenase [Chytridium lagenaria]|nr:molybdopterin binding aldehyde oxidase/xanthine dehydrogenase [Chytridium lagenaria]